MHSSRFTCWRMAAMVAMTALFGCASLGAPKPEPVTVPQIIAWSQAGVAPEKIIDRIRRSDTVYRLKASEYADLKEQGVSEPVLNYMQQTYLDEIRRNSFLRERHYWTPGGAGYWYGGSPYGWPYYRHW